MTERLYTDHPDLYDAIQSAWDYDRDVAFVEAVRERHGVAGDRLLEVGCGTGEHTRRFAASGFDVVAVDRYEGMLAAAREKCDDTVHEVTLQQATLPDLPAEGPFDVVVAIRGVVNHLAPDELGPALDALVTRLDDGGVLVFDNAPLPPAGNHPALDVGTVAGEEYARIAQHVPADDGRLEWRSLTVTTGGEVVVNSRPMTPFDDATVADALDRHDLAVELHDGYGEGDDRTVFVAVA